MPAVAFYTLGCKVNQYETMMMESLFLDRGYQVVNFKDEADIFLINTCTVTHIADRKSRQMIKRAIAKGPGALVVVTGCYAEAASQEIKRIPGVSLVVGNQEKERIVEKVEGLQSIVHRGQRSVKVSKCQGIKESRSQESIVHRGQRSVKVSKCQGIKKSFLRKQEQEVIPAKAGTRSHSCESRNKESRSQETGDKRTRALVKVQDGCQQFCSYCIIPYVRSKIFSKDPESVLEEVRGLVSSGFKEIVLCGVRLGSYGKDLNGKKINLAKLIYLLEKVRGMGRIRLSSIELEGLTAEVLEAIKNSNKLCPHLHLPLQSGSDLILKKMGRGYTRGEYEEVARSLKHSIPNLAITTDVMVGFPGEREEDFKDTCSLIKEIGFARIHVFKYSRRPGTKAANFADEVKFEVLKRRSEKLIRLAEEEALLFKQKYIGQTLEVLIEGRDKKSGYLEGLSDNYIRVLIESPDYLSASQRRQADAEIGWLGRIVPVQIFKADSNFAYGKWEGRRNQ